jgi:ribokinase
MAPAGPQVLVAGAIHMDVVVTAPRLPRPDETLPGSAVAYPLGGKGANQAMAAARMGARVAMAGRVGRDAFGARLRATLEAGGVDVAQVVEVPGESGMSVAILQADGSYGAVIVSGVNAGLRAEEIALPDGLHTLVLQNEVPAAVNEGLAARARGAGAEVILNAGPARAMAAALARTIDILVVNRVEAADLLGVAELGDPVDAARALAALGPRAVIVTLGAGGLVGYADGGVFRQLGFPARVMSTHGAGDAFIGALAARRAAGAGLQEAALFGQAYAALVVATPPAARGAITPDAVAALL